MQGFEMSIDGKRESAVPCFDDDASCAENIAEKVMTESLRQLHLPPAVDVPMVHHAPSMDDFLHRVCPWVMRHRRFMEDYDRASNRVIEEGWFPTAEVDVVGRPCIPVTLKEETARRRTYLCGCLLVVASGFFFVISIYAIVISKLLPATGHGLLDAIREDTHYCYLVPLTIYPSCAALYLSWVSLKFFRHN